MKNLHKPSITQKIINFSSFKQVFPRELNHVNFHNLYNIFSCFLKYCQHNVKWQHKEKKNDLRFIKNHYIVTSREKSSTSH